MSFSVSIIGICGGSASGKSTLAEKLQEKIGPGNCAILSMDNFYIDFVNQGYNPEEINYDHPESFDIKSLVSSIKHLKLGESCSIPLYDFTTHTRLNEACIIGKHPYIIVEGLFLYIFPEISSLFSLKIFLDTPPEIRLQRRIERDMQNRGRSRESVIRQFEYTVKPMHDQYVEKNKELADIIVDGKAPFKGPIEQILKRLM
jgi:uridine kinase